MHLTSVVFDQVLAIFRVFFLIPFFGEFCSIQGVGEATLALSSVVLFFVVLASYFDSLL